MRRVSRFVGLMLAAGYIAVPANGVAAPVAAQSVPTTADQRLRALYDGYAAWDAQESGVFEDSRGETKPTSHLPKVDAAVVDSLQKNNVRVIVLEKDSWVLNHNLWKQMPKLKAWIETDFDKVKDFGIYEVRVSSATAR